VDNGGPPSTAAVDETLGEVTAEGHTVTDTTDTCGPVEAATRLKLPVLDGCRDGDAVLDVDCSCLSDVMPLAANSSLTRTK